MASTKKTAAPVADALRFGHPARTLSFWRSLAKPILHQQQSTPFYLFSIAPIQRALTELDASFRDLPVRHWLSTKTQPLRPLLQWWQKQNRPIEVVSEFELQAALHEGFAPENILVNGPAKQHWLPRQARPGLMVNFDSTAEALTLAPLARQLHWTTGLRLLTREEFDPENRAWPTQFGLTGDEAIPLLLRLRRAGLDPQVAHFHLRTNVASPANYERALREVAEICRTARWTPRVIDFGGGFPPNHVFTREGQAMAAEFDLAAMATAYRHALKQFPGLEEIWLENGRWLTARSGVFVVTILQAKERRGLRTLICDGGRTQHALVSNWEEHELLSVPHRFGPTCLTTVNGPTCMAFDQLTRRKLPRTLRPGDRLIWMEAGAYHLPWETRFSHGLAAVYWHDGKNTRLVRPRETFTDWWAHWS